MALNGLPSPITAQPLTPVAPAAQPPPDPNFLAFVASQPQAVQDYFHMLAAQQRQQQTVQPYHDPNVALPGTRYTPEDPRSGMQPINPVDIKSPYKPPAPYEKPPEPTFDPSTDPSFLAFHRALQASEDSMRANIAQRVANAQQQVNDQIPGLHEQLQRRRHDIEMSRAAQGTWSSSGRLNEQNQADQDEASTEQGLRNGLAQQQSGFESELQNQLGQDARDTSEQQLAAEARLRQQWAQQQADKETAYNARSGDQYRSYLQRRAAFGAIG